MGGVTYTPQPGDMATCIVPGPVSPLIRLGEWANGDGFRPAGHAFIYIGHGDIVGANPGGARQNRLATTGYIDITWSAPAIQPTAAQRSDMVHHALALIGTPYSALDYLALSTHRLHLPAPGLRAYVASTRHLICSQLVDAVACAAGVHLFTDGRWPGYVTPAELYNLFTTRGAADVDA